MRGESTTERWSPGWLRARRRAGPSASAGTDPAWAGEPYAEIDGAGHEVPSEPERDPIHPGSGRGGTLKRVGVPIAAAAIFAATKLKALLLILPKLKFLTTSGSMLVSIAAYQLIFGWAFAVGFVFLLLIHELGHVIQLRREGIQASAPMFIPFLGAVISAKSLGDDAAAEARVGLAGPILGSLAALVPLAIWLATGDEFWRALAYIGFILNLFNLLPIVPLDGGRAMAALSPWVWFAGFAGLVALTFIFPNPIMLLILIFGGMESWRRWKLRKTPEGRAFHAVPARTRVFVAVTYLVLAGLLAFGVSETFFARSLADV
jgi:Zn-dependent protease